MKREHTAYVENFLEPVPKSTDFAWRVNVIPVCPKAFPVETLSGIAKSYAEARAAAQAAGDMAMEKHRKNADGSVKPIKEGA